MKKILALGVVILLSIASIFFIADGKTDPFYKKFTSSKQSSLILGSSRISRGVMPSVINKELEGVQSYNYAFTYNSSPYGEVYLKSIKRKLDTTVSNQIFILGVDPWVLSISSNNSNDLNVLSEEGNFLETLTTVNSNPNFCYLIHNYSEPYIKILYNKSPFFVQDDGFLKLTVQLSEELIEKKTRNSISDYSERLKGYQFSKLRMAYLKETISFLKLYGEVYLLRPPINLYLLDVENNLSPNFDQRINHLANEMNVHYFNFSTQGSDFDYSDGHHLLPNSANTLSLEIASRIKQLKP